MSKNHLLQIRLDESNKKLLEQVCHNEKITLSEKVRELIQDYAKNQLRDESMTKKNVNKMTPKWANNESKKVFSVGEMYSGPGGIGVALSKAVLKTKTHDLSFEHSWATDYDADTCKTYKNNLLKMYTMK